MSDEQDTALRRIGQPRLDEAARLQAIILEETLAMLRVEGSEGFSVDQLVARIGVTKRTSYRHHQNKNELIKAVVSPEVDRLIQVATDPEPRSDDVRSVAIADLYRWSAQLFDYLHQPQTMTFYNYICFEAASNGDIRLLFTKWHESMRNDASVLIVRAQTAGALVPGNADRLALLLLDMIAGQNRRALLGAGSKGILGGDAPQDYFQFRWSAFLSLFAPRCGVGSAASTDGTPHPGHR